MRTTQLKTRRLSDIMPEPGVKIKVTKRHIELYPLGIYPNGYCIELSRVKTMQKVLGWIDHLSGKTWMSKHDLVRFTSVVFRLNGIEIGRDI